MAASPRHLRLVRELALAAQGSVEVGELARRICQIVCEAFALDRVTLSKYERAVDEVTQLAAFGLEDGTARDLAGPRPANPDEKRAIATRAPVFRRDADEEAVAGEPSERRSAASALVLPLFTEERPVGFLGATTSSELGDDVRAELGAVAALTETLLEKALADEETRRVSELKDQFISLASHELRTPASVIYGISSTLQARGSDLREEQRVELRAALHAQSVRLNQLVQQLLDLSRLEGSAIRVNPVRIPVRTRIEELVLVLAEQRAKEVKVEISPELEAVVDPAALDRIASNLITNALRYGAPPVRIDAAQHDRHFRLSVEDRGDGIDPELAPRLFERFSRGASEQDGSGLGLAIARSFARAHGGELLYEPVQPHGARFELLLPRLTDAAER